MRELVLVSIRVHSGIGLEDQVPTIYRSAMICCFNPRSQRHRVGSQLGINVWEGHGGFNPRSQRHRVGSFAKRGTKEIRLVVSIRVHSGIGLEE